MPFGEDLTLRGKTHSSSISANCGRVNQISAYSLPMPLSAIPPASASPPGLRAIGVFLLFGATMACLAGVTLVLPGTVLDRMWALNPRAYKELAPLGRAVGVVFLVLAMALAAAGLGWFKRRRWGWQLAVAIFATQVSGDLVQFLTGHVREGAAGMAIAGAILLYIVRPRVRAAFSVSPK